MSVYDGRPPRPNPEPWPEGRVPTNNLERLIASAPRPPETPKPERRAAPAAQLDAELPPVAPKGPFADYSAEEVEAYAREYVAPYAERIRLLTEELATFKAEHATLRAGQSIDTPEFRELLQELWMCIGSAKRNKVAAKLIAYIDGRTAGTAWISTEDRMPKNGANVVIIGPAYGDWSKGRYASIGHYVDGVFYDEDGNDMHPPSHWIAAAPSPQSAKEGANG